MYVHMYPAVRLQTSRPAHARPSLPLRQEEKKSSQGWDHEIGISTKKKLRHDNWGGGRFFYFIFITIWYIKSFCCRQARPVAAESRRSEPAELRAPRALWRYTPKKKKKEAVVSVVSDCLPTAYHMIIFFD